MLYLRDGVKILTFAQNTPITHDGFLNPLQEQVAAALKSQWLQIPILGNWFGEEGKSGDGWEEDWNFDRGDTTTIPVLKTVGPAISREAYLNLHGHPLFRAGAVIQKIDIATGGATANEGKILLVRRAAFQETGQYPGAWSTVASIAAAGDDPFGGGEPNDYKVVSAVELAHTVADGYQYAINVTSPTADAQITACRMYCEYPKTP